MLFLLHATQFGLVLSSSSITTPYWSFNMAVITKMLSCGAEYHDMLLGTEVVH